jgi:hypothetical protein
MNGQPIDPNVLRKMRSENSRRAMRLSQEEKMEQMWNHGSERRLNPYIHGPRRLVGCSIPIQSLAK